MENILKIMLLIATPPWQCQRKNLINVCIFLFSTKNLSSLSPNVTEKQNLNCSCVKCTNRQMKIHYAFIFITKITFGAGPSYFYLHQKKPRYSHIVQFIVP